MEPIFVIMGLLAMLLAVRVTEKPFKISVSVTESAANTYTQVELALPSLATPSIVQGIEVMKIISRLLPPSIEPGQDNNTRMQLVKDTRTALANFADTEVIWERSLQLVSEDAAAIENNYIVENVKFDDLTDGDGNGIILAENSIFLAIFGTGNAAASNGQVQIIAHLVHMSAEEVILESVIND